MEGRRCKAGRLEGWRVGGLVEEIPGPFWGNKTASSSGNNHLAELERADLGIQSLVQTSGGAPETSYVGVCP